MNTLRRWSHRHEQGWLFLVWDAIWLGIMAAVLIVGWLR